VVVRVAAKQKPKLIKWTALVKAGDSPQATRVGNEIGSNLIDVGTAAGIQESKLQGVLDVIDTPGATHAELAKDLVSKALKMLVQLVVWVVADTLTSQEQ